MNEPGIDILREKVWGMEGGDAGGGQLKGGMEVEGNISVSG